MTRNIFAIGIILLALTMITGCANWMYNSPAPEFHLQVTSGKAANDYDPNLDDIEVYFNSKLIGKTEMGGYLKLMDAPEELGDGYREVLEGDMIELRKGDYYAFKRITAEDIEKGRKYRKIDPENFEVFNNDDAANFVRILIVDYYTGLTFFYQD